jgi:hypothetical protein
VDNKARCAVNDDAVCVTILMGAELEGGGRLK